MLTISKPPYSMHTLSSSDPDHKIATKRALAQQSIRTIGDLDSRFRTLYSRQFPPSLSLPVSLRTLLLYPLLSSHYLSPSATLAGCLSYCLRVPTRSPGDTLHTLTLVRSNLPMPRPKTAKKERTCLVCGGTTNVAHLGLDMCRACTVFYRRSRDRKFACRSNTNNCPIGEGVNCRKCRLNEMERMLSEQPNRTKVVKREATTAPSTPAEERNYEPDHADMCSPSTSTSVPQSCNCDGEKAKPRQLLEKLRQGYRAMCETRLAGEMAARKEPPSPLAVVDGDFVIIPSHFGGMEYANRLFLTSLLQFGANTFPEFSTFLGKDRWTMVTKFFTRYRFFDAAYRADKAFPDDMTKTFANYTMFFSHDTPDHHFDDCPNDNAFKEEAALLMKAKFKRDIGSGRRHIRRVNLSHEEFLAVLAFMFWSTEGFEVSEEVARASESYKERILKELHSYYREELQLNDYATRLGELLMLQQMYEQRSAGIKEHLDVLRILNVFTDNSMVCSLASSNS
ncbi:hypothetical protein PENTCL1PPCAC_15597 [Pristionchus entomophagus]|uniref:Nuclear receptor n=1 Tax=Pristionchus entomophagus TaxID=358040 RepID=A0AAV5TF87_9BILA|nr:hypothetical protein PENTCL1PPCAC_15597 [Pristionchus entomophagus]